MQQALTDYACISYPVKSHPASVHISFGEREMPARDRKSPQSKGGIARAKSLTSEEKSSIARKAAAARWEQTSEEVIVNDASLPEAKHWGVLRLNNAEIPCYVLDDGRRVIGRTSATEMLTGIKGGGALEKYLAVNSLKPFIDLDLVLEGMVPFRLPEVEGLDRAVKGLPADLLIDICRGFTAALDASGRKEYDGARLTDRQQEMAVNAAMFVAACAKVGIDALIDEATGYQYERASDALEVKLRAYLADEMRAWEKTFPDELWVEFGRLTGWTGAITKRPKYWGKLVMDLIYEYLDPDVAVWLRENAPEPRGGQNYHQWLSAQFGLRKLVEHIWMVIGIAKTCESMPELKQRMAQLYGREAVQFTMYLPAPKPTASN